MSKQRVLVLVREGHVPPETLEGVSEAEMDPWKAEFDVCETLRRLGHHVLPLGVFAQHMGDCSQRRGRCVVCREQKEVEVFDDVKQRGYTLLRSVVAHNKKKDGKESGSDEL